LSSQNNIQAKVRADKPDGSAKHPGPLVGENHTPYAEGFKKNHCGP